MNVYVDQCFHDYKKKIFWNFFLHNYEYLGAEVRFSVLSNQLLEILTRYLN